MLPERNSNDRKRTELEKKLLMNKQIALQDFWRKTGKKKKNAFAIKKTNKKKAKQQQQARQQRRANFLMKFNYKL